MHLDRRAARAAHRQPAPVLHRLVRARAHIERHLRERLLAYRPGGPEQLQPETAWILPPLVGSHLGRWPLSSRPRPIHHAATRVALCHSRLLVRREGNGPPTGRLRRGPVHRLLRQLPPPHEFGLERVDWFVSLPPRGPSVPRTPRPEEARPLCRASALPRFPSPVDDAPDRRHDLGARRPGTAPRDRSRALLPPVLCPRRGHRSRARDPGMGILLRGRLAFPLRPLGGGRARPLPGNCSPVD